MYFFALLLILLSCIAIFRLKQFDAINKIPGPTWWEMFKLSFLGNTNIDIYRYLLTLPKKHGPVVKLWLKPLPPVLFVADSKYFERILGSKEHLHKTSMYDFMHDIIGNGLTSNQNVTEWTSHRKMLNNIFSRESVSNYSLEFRHHLDNLRNLLNSHENEPVEVMLPIHHCTVHIIVEYLTQENMSEEEASQLAKCLVEYFELFLQRTYSVWKSSDTIFKFTKGYKTWVESSGAIHNIINNILQRQIELRKGKSWKAGKKNFMDVLLDSPMPRESILNQLKTFLLAGFDSSAVTVSLALFEIAKRPDVQESILQEYFSLIGPDKGSAITYPALQSMTYTGAVIKETLRMYPGIPLIQRRLKSPVTIDGLTIPGDIDVIFSIQSLHNLNFPHPNEFNPDRFSPSNLSKIKPNIYAPFSIGPRDCIGRRIAMAEMKYIISYIVKHFTLHPVQPEHQLELVGEYILNSKNGIPIIFRMRR